jgi:hypothetical protein
MDDVLRWQFYLREAFLDMHNVLKTERQSSRIPDRAKAHFIVSRREKKFGM